MKTPRFWYEVENIIGHVLAPLGIFYILGHAVRCALARPYRARVPVICVGNIVAGGSGKTPTALALAEILVAAGQRPVFVTRGYGGNITHAVQVDALHHTADDVGDEALLLARAAPTFAGRDRVAAIKLAEPHATHIILDDGLQNPNIAPDIGLLVVDGATGFGNGKILPAGPLRETLRHALPRVHAVVMIGADAHNLAAQIPRPIISAHLQHVLPPDFPRTGKFFAFAGIARPQKFYDTCRAVGLDVVGTHDFSDHHVFAESELRFMHEKAAALGAHMVTTEKDFVRIPAHLRTGIVTLPVKLVLNNAVLAQILRL